MKERVKKSVDAVDVKPFKFELDQKVTLVVSGEKGVIIGRAEYNYMTPQYLVRYKAADGRGVQDWWPENALK